MCLGVPGQILEITDDANDTALVLLSGARRAVNIALVREEGIAPGDWVMVHAGFALSKIDAQEAHDLLDMIQEMSAAYGEGIGAPAPPLGAH